MIQKARVFIGWALIGLLVLFIFFNLGEVTVRLFVMKVTMPIAFVIIFSAVLGAAAVHFLKFFRKRESK